MVLQDQIEFIYIFQEQHRKNVVFVELHLIWWSMILICPIIDEIRFDPLKKVVGAGLFHCNVTLSLLKTNTYVGNYVR